MSDPLVSICIPCLNTRPYLEERMETILAQTLQDWEVIVCDSFSDDGSWEFFKKFSSDERFRLYQVPRHGLYAGWNECLRRARGEFIYIATSDDTMAPELLDRLLRPLARRPDVDIAVCDHYRIDERSCVIPRGRRTSDALGKWAGVPSVRNGQTEFLFHLCCYSLWSTMNSVLFRRSLLDRVGLFSTEHGSSGDYEWTLRASLATDIAWVPEELAGFRRHASQATPQSYDAENYLRTLRISQGVLGDTSVGIPKAWRAVPHWQSRLLACQYSRYVRSLQLYPKNARRRPFEFFGHLFQAARQQPQWLLGWMRHGFRYTGRDYLKPKKYVYELIDFLNAPWPPEEVVGGW